MFWTSLSLLTHAFLIVIDVTKVINETGFQPHNLDQICEEVLGETPHSLLSTWEDMAMEPRLHSEVSCPWTSNLSSVPVSYAMRITVPTSELLLS